MRKTQNTVEFDQSDPFNGNRVQGYIYRSKNRYGDMKITHVNRIPYEQYIFGTPKILHLEKNIHQITFQQAKIFEKIDGTNILLYRYRDIRGNVFISYKTRLSPFLRPQPYGNFIELWKAMLCKYSTEFSSLAQAEYFFGFELFGSRLRILTDYHTDLDARLLYAIDPNNGKVVDPEKDPAWNFPAAPKIAEFCQQQSIAEMHRYISDSCDQDVRSGKLREGAMFYFFNDSDSYATLYKCKPPEVIARQQRYGELYTHGKTIPRHTANGKDVASALGSYVSKHWDAELRKKYRRIIDIATEDITHEMEFDRQQPPEKRTGELQNIPERMVLWKSLWGSHLWGMDRPDSDKDCCVVYQVDSRTLLLGAFNQTLLHEHQRGTRHKTETNDEHWYELGRAVQLILKGSLTMLYGVMSPLVVDASSTALEELRELLGSHPSKVFYRALLRDVRDSEKAMQRASDREFYLKHLRIACRNLQFGITLFESNRYKFLPSFAENHQELEELRLRVIDAYENSPLPATFDPEPFEEYVLRWRRQRLLLDF